MTIDKVAEAIVTKRKELPAERSMLVGISGIDGSGKGYVAAKIGNLLADFETAVINVDPWLNLPHVRFDPADPAANFYKNALRLEHMFEELILPLKLSRNVDLLADVLEETADRFHNRRYLFDNVDIVLLEGIFLFKKAFQDYFDLKLWIDCSFDTALDRAIARSQEGLPPDATVKAYETIYFPAQRIHFEVDAPRSSADLVLVNDSSNQ